MAPVASFEQFQLSDIVIAKLAMLADWPCEGVGEVGPYGAAVQMSRQMR
jgi:hypothetical protein